MHSNTMREAINRGLITLIDFTSILASDPFLLIELEWLMQHICCTDFEKIYNHLHLHMYFLK